MRRINRCLNKQLRDICQNVVQLDVLNEKLAAFLPNSLQGSCQVASFNRGCLLICIIKPALATELRYYLPTLRDALRQEGGLYQLLSIKIQVDPGTPTCRA